MMAKSSAAQASTTTFNKDGGAPAEAAPDALEPPKPAMVDERTTPERLADIKRINQDMQNVLAAEIEKGKPCLIHPRVVGDQKFLLDHIDVLARKVRLYEKKLEMEPAEA